jgi:MFS family permease
MVLTIYTPVSRRRVIDEAQEFRYMNLAWTRRSIYYGWIIAATLAVTQTVSWGVLYYSFSVFLTSFEDDLASSRTVITGAFSLALLCSGLIALPVGRWIDQHGARGIMTLGSILATVLFAALSAVQSLPMLYLIWAGIGITMAMTLYEPAFAVVAVWFVRRRTSALALITFVAGLASTIFLPLADWLRQEFGWRSAIMLLALLLGAVTIPLHAFVLRRHPRDLGLVADGEEAQSAGKPQRPAERSRTLHAALRDRAFWWMVVAFVLTTFSTIAISVHLIPYLITRGVTPATAAQVAGLIGIMQVIGRITITPLDERLARYLLTALIFALHGLAVLALLLPGFGAVLLFVVLFGATAGAATLARPALIAEHYGSKAYGQISGVVATCLTGARALAPVGAGALYVAFGSYIPVIVGVAALAALAVVATLLVGNPAPTELVPEAD